MGRCRTCRARDKRCVGRKRGVCRSDTIARARRRRRAARRDLRSGFFFEWEKRRCLRRRGVRRAYGRGGVSLVPRLKMARRVSRSDDASGPRAAWWSVAGNARTRSDPGVIVPSAGGVRDARRAVGVVVAAGCAGEGGVSSAFASGNRCAVMRGKRAGSVVRALRSCASIVRTLACDEDVRFKTYLARRRVQRIAPRAPAGPCRETHARASSRSRPRQGQAGASHAPRLLRQTAVPFPAIYGARSTVDSASLRNSRVARASLLTRAGACVGAKLWRVADGRRC